MACSSPYGISRIVVQGVVGFGLGVLAAPVVGALAPELMPGAVIMASLALPPLTWDGRAGMWTGQRSGGYC